MEKEKILRDFERLGGVGEYQMLADTGDTVVLRLENETGEGDMIIYQVFEGIYLMYNDFHMAHYNSVYQAQSTVLAIDYCREGSLVMETDNGFCQVKKAGSICIDSRVHHQGIVNFPSGHFHGITIGFESDMAQRTLDKKLPGVPVDLIAIRDKFCGGDGYFIIKEEETLKRLFKDLYHVPERAREKYFKVKVMELLVCLSAIEKEGMEESRAYFYREQVEKVQAVKKLITEDLRLDYSTAKLAERFDISETALKNCFKGVYGKPIYTWLREYRINKACELLKAEPVRSIGEIAFLVGYENAGKFAGAFKKVCGMTPKEYRSQPY